MSLNARTYLYLGFSHRMFVIFADVDVDVNVDVDAAQFGPRVVRCRSHPAILASSYTIEAIPYLWGLVHPWVKCRVPTTSSPSAGHPHYISLIHFYSPYLILFKPDYSHSLSLSLSLLVYSCSRSRHTLLKRGSLGGHLPSAPLHLSTSKRLTSR